MDVSKIIFTILGLCIILGIFSIPILIVIYINLVTQPHCQCNINEYVSNIVSYWTIFVTLYFIIYTILVSIKQDFRNLQIFNKYLAFVMIILSLLSSIYIFYLIGNLDKQNCKCLEKMKGIHNFLLVFRYFIIIFVCLFVIYGIQNI